MLWTIGNATAGDDGQGLELATEGTIDMETTHAASSTHTPRAERSNTNDGATKAMSATQPPAPHMRFDTLLEAKKHYRRYARRKDFDIRYDYRKPSEATCEFIREAMVCIRGGHDAKNKEDTQNQKPGAPERKRNTHPRTNCPARMTLKLRDGSWLVTEVNDNHNHPLSRNWSLTSFLRGHRDIPEEEK